MDTMIAEDGSVWVCGYDFDIATDTTSDDLLNPNFVLDLADD